MNRSSAALLLCVAGAAAGCSQGNLTPSTGNGMAGATSMAGGPSGSAGSSGAPVSMAGTDAGGAPSAGADMGGAPAMAGSAGMTMGGTTGMAGSAGAAPVAGAAGMGAGGAPTVESIVPTLDNFFWLGKCGDAQGSGKDCPVYNDVGAQCATSTKNPPDWFATGAFRVATHKVGGTVGTKYVINFDVRGMTGGKHYDGGMRQGTDTNYNQTGNDGWYAGGTPSPTKWNTYEIHVSPPVPGVAVNNQALTCTDCPKTPDNVYFTNAFGGIVDGTHEVFPVKFSASFPVLGGGTITLIIHDSNCLAQQNCGTNTDPAAMCEAPRAVDMGGFAGVPPAGFAQPYSQQHAPNNWYPQWLLFDVKSISQ